MTDRHVTHIWHHRWYHTWVNKTTIYLPDDLKATLKRVAAERGVSEAELLRTSLRAELARSRPSPRFGFIPGGGESIAERVDELLEGFGER